MSGAIFNLVFTLVSFSVLWLQPAEPKSFFISLLIAGGSWWTNLIAQTVDRVKLYFFDRELREQGLLIKLLVRVDLLLRVLGVFAGLILFWISLMGVMGYLTLEFSGAEASITVVVGQTPSQIPGFIAHHILHSIPLLALVRINIAALILSVLILIFHALSEKYFYENQQYKALCLKYGNCIATQNEQQDPAVL